MLKNTDWNIDNKSSEIKFVVSFWTKINVTGETKRWTRLSGLSRNPKEPHTWRSFWLDGNKQTNKQKWIQWFPVKMIRSRNEVDGSSVSGAAGPVGLESEPSSTTSGSLRSVDSVSLVWIKCFIWLLPWWLLSHDIVPGCYWVFSNMMFVWRPLSNRLLQQEQLNTDYWFPPYCCLYHSPFIRHSSTDSEKTLKWY